MRVLVTGAGGMVGQAVVKHCAQIGDEVFAHDRLSLDIEDETQVRTVFEREQPEVVINCAAWTDVDKCELNPERAFMVNARGPEILASESRNVSASLVTISTDYVFDGEKAGFYTQRDDPNPRSVYASAKLEGERRAQAASARTIVVRTGWIFGPHGRNFLSRVVELAERGERLKVISDAYGTPTYALDLAARLRHLAEINLPGIYHVVNDGDGASYEEFAREALGAGGLDASILESVKVDSLDRPAPRPRNSRLHCLLSEAMGLPALPQWRAALRGFIAAKH
jgi:dTDP-4-dehydrorhamnose reductase